MQKNFLYKSEVGFDPRDSKKKTIAVYFIISKTIFEYFLLDVIVSKNGSNQSKSWQNVYRHHTRPYCNIV
jgi:hypothetical protein